MMSGRRFRLLSVPITAATLITGATPELNLAGMEYAAIESKFVYGSGGTKVTAYLQTSLDGGATWIDIACQTFTTASGNKVSAVFAQVALAPSVVPTDGSIADDTILQGLLGDRLRIKWKSTGTYAGGTTLSVYGVAK